MQGLCGPESGWLQLWLDYTLGMFSGSEDALASSVGELRMLSLAAPGPSKGLCLPLNLASLL